MTQQGMHVLIVDDDLGVCDILSRALAEAGIGLTVCHGERGLGELRQSPIRFDLIITNTFSPHAKAPGVVAYLRDLFPGRPILHLEEVAPFTVQAFLAAVQRRSRGEVAETTQ